MYTFLLPNDPMSDFMILQPGQVTYHRINLGQAGYTKMAGYSIHAVASADVKVTPLIANFPLDFDNPDYGDTFWSPSESIVPFTVKAGDNFFVQSEFIDTCQHIAFKLEPSADADKEIAFTMRLCLKSSLATKGIKPRPKPTPDFYSAVQGSTLTIDVADILNNDQSEFPLVAVEVGNAIGGTVTLNNDKIIFVSTGRYGSPASFTYRVQDDQGTWSNFPCLVTVDLQMLPRVEGYIFNTEELEEFANSYVPPTLAQIFKEWNRYYYNSYYPSGTKPGGEAANWEMLGTNQFRCTVNSTYLTGFLSPKEFEYYEHQADLSSTDSDDDAIAIVIAHARVGNSNKSLLLYRESGGIPGLTSKRGFSLVYMQDNTSSIVKLPATNKCWSGSPSENQGNYGWNKTSPTRVKVIRNGDKIQIQSSPFKSTDLSAGEMITIDLNDYTQLSWAKGPHSYGYACYSQKFSTYSNVEFSGSGNLEADELYNLDTGDVYTFQSGHWLPNGVKIWDHLGYPREIKNAKNGKIYLINKDSITEITP